MRVLELSGERWGKDSLNMQKPTHSYSLLLYIHKNVMKKMPIYYTIVFIPIIHSFRCKYTKHQNSNI